MLGIRSRGLYDEPRCFSPLGVNVLERLGDRGIDLVVGVVVVERSTGRGFFPDLFLDRTYV